MNPDIIALMTDFGLQDPYVGIMKGVILSIHRDVHLIDITHQIPPGDVVRAATLLLEALPFFPKGTIHLVVVDPGVGGTRRPILVLSKDQMLVGPDNGIFWPVVLQDPGSKVLHLNEPSYFLPRISHTFHGRDVFAPVAAHLARGVHPFHMGRPIGDMVMLQMAQAVVSGEALEGEIVRADGFGNLITNIHREQMEAFLAGGEAVILVGETRVPGLTTTYSNVPEGEWLALYGSSGHLEIAVNRGRASERLGRGKARLPGMKVAVTRK